MASLHLLSIAASLFDLPSIHVGGASFTPAVCYGGHRNTVNFLQQDLAHAPVFRLLYGAPANGAARVETFLHFYGPIKSQSEDQLDASGHFRFLRTC